MLPLLLLVGNARARPYRAHRVRSTEYKQHPPSRCYFGTPFFRDDRDDAYGMRCVPIRVLEAVLGCRRVRRKGHITGPNLGPVTGTRL